jgi:hypothetical protein
VQIEITIVTGLSAENNAISACSNTQTGSISSERSCLAEIAESCVGVAAHCTIGVIAGEIAVGGVDQYVRTGAGEAIGGVAGIAPFC